MLIFLMRIQLVNIETLYLFGVKMNVEMNIVAMLLVKAAI